jgi:hypothetical protein
MTAPKTMILVLALLTLIGCSGGDEQNTQAEAGAQAEAVADSTADFAFNEEAHLSVTDMGQFEAFWPSGCGKTRARTIESETSASGYYAVESTCDCFGRQDLGVKVTVYLEMPDGTIAKPENVTAGIKSVVDGLGLTIGRQMKAERDGMEGVAVYCVQNDGVGAEGYLYHGKIMQTMAWGPDGSLYENAEIVQFMRSVRFVE